MTPRITIARGNGIGPEIMEATLQVLDAAGVNLEYDTIEIGYDVYKSGNPTGIQAGAIDILRKNKVFLKAPIITPQGGGNKSVTVTIRRSLGLFANVRPSRSFLPYIPSHFPNMDLVVIRENEEDLYTGIEHQPTTEVVQCLKLISRQGAERVIRYAFEYARAYGRNRVSCMTKDNIMKRTDGLFHQVFNEVAEEYPDIEADHYIIDIGAALLAARPETFDVVVTLNLYGDILTDITSQISGSVGLGGSVNVGRECAMFEAVHGAAPDIAGKGVANPSGLINAACLMLLHLGQSHAAATIQNAWLKTLEDGIHTGDMVSQTHTQQRVGTRDFTKALIDRLGEMPRDLPAVKYQTATRPLSIQLGPQKETPKRLVGVDVFLDWSSADRDPARLAAQLQQVQGAELALHIISNRGLKVFPDPIPGIPLTDHWCGRFLQTDYEEGSQQLPLLYKKSVFSLLARIDQAGLEVVQVVMLYEIDGAIGFSVSQGE